MERLTNMRVALGEGDSAAATLAALVVAAEPLAASAERQARVLTRVLERRRWRRSLVGLVVRPAFALPVLLLVGMTTAAATIAPRLQARRWGWLSHPAVAPVVSGPAPVVSRRSVAARAQVPAAPAPSLPVRAVGPSAAPRSGDDPSRIIEAVRALRGEDDPARAERLALEYLRVHPRGALTEEALAVAIEAAARRHDARTAGLAERYLQTYPDGRFRRMADQALQRTR